MAKPKTKSQRVSVADIARKQRSEDAKLRKVRDKAMQQKTVDSFVNFGQMLGIGADNALSTATYGFNPITRVRTLLEWIHRGSWLGGVAIDIKAEDMTREGVELKGEITPEDSEKIEEAAVSLKIWDRIRETIQWSRLYGGAGAVIMIDGQDWKTPLRLDRIDKGAFKGLAVLDRWMVDPSLSNLVTDPGPDMGLPKFYKVIDDSPALRGMTIHHSRVIRMIGIELPYWQRLTENLWGISVLERLYDRMIAFDSATTGAAQLVYKAYIRTYKIKDLRDIISGGGKPYQGLLAMVDLMRRFAGQEGITLLDAEDSMEAMQTSAFSGLAEAILQFAQQLAGALQIPLIRLLGQSPAGLNSSGDSDLRTYYDGIKKDQKAILYGPVTKVYRAMAMSEGVRLPEGFKIAFNPLWQLTDKEKAEIAETDTRSIAAAEEAGLISQQTAMKELRQSSNITGRFSNITDSEIDAAEESLPPAGENAMGALGGEALGQAAGAAKEGLDPETMQPTAEKKAKDSAAVVSSIKKLHDLNIAIESPRGSIRKGKGWQVVMPADYGYLSGVNGRDGAELDLWVGREHASPNVYVIKQMDPVSGAYDEDKVMLGYGSMDAALTDFFSGHTDGAGWKRIGGVAQFNMKDFKAWMGRPASDRWMFAPMERE